MSRAGLGARLSAGFFIGVTLFAIVACTDVEPGPGGPPTLAPNQPPTSGTAVIDWEDPAKGVQLDGGWAVQACEGEGAFLCVERDGQTVGVVEATSFPIGSFDVLDPRGDPRENLELFASGFAEAIGSDRAAGCGSDYDFDSIPVSDFVLGGTPGIEFGFVGTLPDGKPSELNLQYATVVGDQILSIVAIAYDEGGCPGRDELSSFDSATLAEFRPRLEAILHESPLPDIGIPAPPGY